MQNRLRRNSFRMNQDSEGRIAESGSGPAASCQYLSPIPPGWYLAIGWLWGPNQVALYTMRTPSVRHPYTMPAGYALACTTPMIQNSATLDCWSGIGPFCC
jgi:hypothetical protein